MTVNEYEFKLYYDEDTNYKSEYDDLIKFRKFNKLEYGKCIHNHHIKPKCFFSNEEYDLQEHDDNLVNLRAQEHFMSHYFLFKIYYNTNKFKRVESMFKSFELILDKIKKQDLSNIIYYSNLYEQSLKEYYEILEILAIDRINEICDFIDENGRIPKRTSNGFERVLYERIATFKTSKYNNKGLWNDSYNTVIKKRGYTSLFDKVDKEVIGLNRVYDICEFIKDNLRNPNRRSKDKYERTLGESLRLYKQYKVGRRNGTWYNSYELLAIELGFPNLFIIIKK